MTGADEVVKALDQLTRELEQIYGRVKTAENHVKGTINQVNSLVDRADGSGNSSLIRSGSEYSRASQCLRNAHAAINAAREGVQKYTTDNFKPPSGGAPGGGVWSPATTGGGVHTAGWSSRTQEGDDHVANSRAARRLALLGEAAWSIAGAVPPLVSLNLLTFSGALGAAEPVYIAAVIGLSQLAQIAIKAHVTGLDDVERRNVTRTAMMELAVDTVIDVVGNVAVEALGPDGKHLAMALDLTALAKTGCDLRNICARWREG